ncbi:hypothetical protein RHODO2019_00035 [Rhodococcus antarcticus]|uniref:Secreted protein n=1 Tax=Rhodococcus antarcticus TaxID=2987751 RepID=A0ABY6P0E8_9NOCA|nr:hypothetical protein [Rhodococcus antarcticus]UZJ24949.1 hypothetical protein RHODO2019_00035 [Rhodococcus antarcticus]
MPAKAAATACAVDAVEATTVTVSTAVSLAAEAEIPALVPTGSPAAVTAAFKVCGVFTTVANEATIAGRFVVYPALRPPSAFGLDTPPRGSATSTSVVDWYEGGVSTVTAPDPTRHATSTTRMVTQRRRSRRR